MQQLWWLCGLPLAASLVFGLVARFVDFSIILEALATGAYALVALVGALKNARLVAKALRLPSVAGILWTLVGACLAWPLVTVMFTLLERAGFRFEADYLLPYLLEGLPPWVGYVSIAVLTPIIEELLFRGLIQPKLQQVLRPTEALVVQAVLFAAAHLSPVILATHFVMGLVFGWVRRRTGSLFPGMVLHGAWNAWVIWKSQG